jgi:hypothetical protein
MHRATSLLILAIGCGTSLAAQSQQPIDPPVLKPFADNREWVLMKDLSYRIGSSTFIITVPKGFVTDFASIPEVFWSADLSPNGKYSKAAIVHDYLYWTQGCTREQADNLLDIAMKESNVSFVTRSGVYGGVRLGGSSAWQKNAAERTQGLPRVIPEASLEFGPLVLWTDYRRTLADQGVHDAPAPANPPYCQAGNTTDVPGGQN